MHMCIVCASISCPNVRMEAFKSPIINEQMDDQVREFVRNNKKGISLYLIMICVVINTLQVSILIKLQM